MTRRERRRRLGLFRQLGRDVRLAQERLDRTLDMAAERMAHDDWYGSAKWVTSDHDRSMVEVVAALLAVLVA